MNWLVVTVVLLHIYQPKVPNTTSTTFGVGSKNVFAILSPAAIRTMLLSACTIFGWKICYL